MGFVKQQLLLYRVSGSTPRPFESESAFVNSISSDFFTSCSFEKYVLKIRLNITTSQNPQMSFKLHWLIIPQLIQNPRSGIRDQSSLRVPHVTSTAANVKLLFYNGSLFLFPLQVLFILLLQLVFLFSLNCNNMINSNGGWPLLSGRNHPQQC